METNHCPKIVRFGCAHRRWLSGLFLRTYTPMSHTHDGWALIVELRGFTRCPFGSSDHSSPSISLRGSCALRSQRCAHCCLVVLQRAHLEEEGRGFACFNGVFFKLSRTWNCEKSSQLSNIISSTHYYPNKAFRVGSKSKKKKKKEIQSQFRGLHDGRKSPSICCLYKFALFAPCFSGSPVL